MNHDKSKGRYFLDKHPEKTKTLIFCVNNKSLKRQ